MLSVIIPSYNEEAMIEKAASTLALVLNENGIVHELIFIDDGSNDSTWELIKKVSADDGSIRGVHFSRNFGKESAIIAGLAEAKGECAVVIDCDLQHPPEKIPEMYSLWQEGYEIIEGQKSDRGKESVAHSLAAKVFYSLIGKAAGVDMENASDFKLLDRKVINTLLSMKEKYAFFRALSSWVGFKTAAVEFDVKEREAGVSKWSTISLCKYAVSNLTSFSTFPIQIITALGIITFIISVVLGCIALIQKFTGQALEGFTTVILIMLFTSSIIMISLGIIGYYIARIYEEIKGRPRYIVSQKTYSDVEDN